MKIPRMGFELWSEDSFPIVIALSAAYVVCVLIACWLMEMFPSFKPNTKLLNSASNFGMCIFSTYIFIGALPPFIENWKATGWDTSLIYCDENQVLKNNMEYWHYLFYMSKFLEFIDTVFLILNRKYSNSVGWYLQVYHHSTTASIAWVAWWLNVPAWWYGLLSNAFVHILMYFYFAVVVYDRRLRQVGHFVTYVQLLQFYLAVGSAVIINIMQDFAGYKCNDDFEGRMFVSLMYLSYLAFFLVFHRERKKKIKKA